jgi:hypothetical protein
MGAPAGDARDLVQELVEREDLRPSERIHVADRLGTVERARERGRHVAQPHRLVAVAAVSGTTGSRVRRSNRRTPRRLLKTKLGRTPSSRDRFR